MGECESDLGFLQALEEAREAAGVWERQAQEACAQLERLKDLLEESALWRRDTEATPPSASGMPPHPTAISVRYTDCPCHRVDTLTTGPLVAYINKPLSSLERVKGQEDVWLPANQPACNTLRWLGSAAQSADLGRWVRWRHWRSRSQQWGPR